MKSRILSVEHDMGSEQFSGDTVRLTRDTAVFSRAKLSAMLRPTPPYPIRTVPGLLVPIIRAPFRACLGVPSGAPSRDPWIGALLGSGLGWLGPMEAGPVRGNAMTSSIAAPNTTTRGVWGATGRGDTGREPVGGRDDATVEVEEDEDDEEDDHEDGDGETGTETEWKEGPEDVVFFRSDRCPAITAATIALLITSATFASRDAPVQHTQQIRKIKS